MGLLDRVKNLFTEEVEEEMPIKKEVKHVEIANPRREIVREEPKVEPVIEEPKKEIVSDSVALNREEKFKFPVYFDDKDFEDLPKREEKKKPEPKKEEPKIEPYKAAKMIEEKKNFRPSPIISPVYGVLDKNYKKDDITAKKEKVTSRYYKKEENLTVDDIRKKAYGTLEDELEDTLYSSEPFVFEKEKEVETEIDIFKELEDVDMKRQTRSNDLLTSDILVEKEENVDLAKELEKQKQKIEEINEFIKQNTVSKEPVSSQSIVEDFEDLPVKEKVIVEEIQDFPVKEENFVDEFQDLPVKEKTEVIENVADEVIEEKTEQLDNGDLFNLIDSMYEKRSEE